MGRIGRRGGNGRWRQDLAVAAVVRAPPRRTLPEVLNSGVVSTRMDAIQFCFFINGKEKREKRDGVDSRLVTWHPPGGQWTRQGKEGPV